MCTAAGAYDKQALVRMLSFIYTDDDVQSKRSELPSIRMTLFTQWTFFFQHLLNTYCNDYSGSCVFPKFKGVLFLGKGDCAKPAWANVASIQTDLIGMAQLTIYVSCPMHYCVLSAAPCMTVYCLLPRASYLIQYNLFYNLTHKFKYTCK